VTQLRQKMLEELQGRKSPRLFLARLRIRWCDVIAEAPELPNHSPRTQLLRSPGDRWATFLVTDSSVEDQPDEPTVPMGNGSDGLIVSQAGDGATIHNLEDASFGPGCSIRRLIEYAPHLTVGAFGLRDLLPRFERGPVIIGVTGKSFKCPPAPSETALLLHDYLVDRGRREAAEISVVMPFGTPIPPSPDTSQAILAAFADRGIRFVKDSLVKALDPRRKVAVLSDGTEMPYELFLGVPVHRVPQVVVESGLAADAYGWVPVNKKTLETNFPGVYAVGDVNGVGTAKAGVFAEGAARVVADGIIAQLRGGPSPEAYKGDGSCYVEFGHGQVGKVHVDFLSGPKPVGTFHGASEALVAEKAHFGSSRLQRWFGQTPS